MKYHKNLLDAANGESGMASAWTEGSFGTSRNVGFIMQGVSESLGNLAEYLRVNEEACHSR